VKKKKEKQMKEEKEREVDDNMSLKNFSMGAEEIVVVRGIAKVQLCVTEG